MAGSTQGQISGRVVELLSTRRDEILNIWIKERLESEDFREELVSKNELRQQSQQIVEMLAHALRESDAADFDNPMFDELRAFLNEISRQRAIKGYTPSENATYILSLRNVVLAILAEDFEGDTVTLVREMDHFTRLLDRMGLVMVENFIRSRGEIIRQQRRHAGTLHARH